MKLTIKKKASSKHYSLKEQEYIERVAGRVPAEVMAKQLKRSVVGVKQWANNHNLKLRVPHHILNKYWRDNGAQKR